MALLSILAALLVRCLLVALFLPFSALDKILNFSQAVGQATKETSSHLFAKLLIFCGLGIEIIMSLGVLTGIADRLAGLVLAIYCILTALLWKKFWREPDFRLKGNSRGREIFWDFLKNIAVAGGFLLLAFGSDALSVRYFFANPLASTQPYIGLNSEALDD